MLHLPGVSLSPAVFSLKVYKASDIPQSKRLSYFTNCRNSLTSSKLHSKYFFSEPTVLRVLYYLSNSLNFVLFSGSYKPIISFSKGILH